MTIYNVGPITDPRTIPRPILATFDNKPLINKCQERPSWALKIVENLWAVISQPLTQLGELTALPRPPSWWDVVAASSTRTPPSSQSSAFRSRPNEKFWTRTRSCSPLVHSVVEGNLDFVVIIVTKEVKKFAHLNENPILNYRDFSTKIKAQLFCKLAIYGSRHRARFFFCSHVVALLSLIHIKGS